MTLQVRAHDKVMEPYKRRQARLSLRMRGPSGFPWLAPEEPAPRSLRHRTFVTRHVRLKHRGLACPKKVCPLEPTLGLAVREAA